MTRIAMTRVVIFSLLILTALSASADVLLIQQVRQGGRLDLPPNGMSMNEVEAAYGTPQEKRAAVGDPPISRWVYDRWSVYFEWDRSLYTVLHEGEVIDGVSEPIIDTGEADESEGGDGTDSG